MEKITAYRAFGIFADYDANAPDTDTIVTVTSEELAKEVCEKLNEDPRRHTVLATEAHRKPRLRLRLARTGDDRRDARRVGSDVPRVTFSPRGRG